MISSPLKDPGPLAHSPRPSQEVALKGILLSSIPGGTPLKALVNFQAASISTPKGAGLPSIALLPCRHGHSEKVKQVDVFQSTLIPGVTYGQEMLDLSAIKAPAEQGLEQFVSALKEKAIPQTRGLLKRKASELLSSESPAKIFSRMKARATIAKQQNQPPGTEELLGATKAIDFIFTPHRHMNLLGKQNVGAVPEENKQAELLGDVKVEKGTFVISFKKMWLY